MDSITRRKAIYLGVAGAIAAVGNSGESRAAKPHSASGEASPYPYLTHPKDFDDVSRGKPNPGTLTGEALINAGLTPQTWKLEIVAEDGASVQKPLTRAGNTALDYAGVLDLGKRYGVRFLKAMQCLNIACPLGQGLWEGVPLREVLALCGKLTEVRRLYYWGFHNDDPKQIFQSSLSINRVLDTPPGEMPPFVAYRLNGEPIPLVRGGPVRMIVPWTHGFKNIKWLQKIVLTNRYECNDTYALAKNDPESYLKTAAYFDDIRPATFGSGAPILIRGSAMVGLPGLDKIEYWIRPAVDDPKKDLPDEDPAWATATWTLCVIDPPPKDWGGGLPNGVLPKDVWGFDASGQPKQWPMRYSLAQWSATLKNLKPGRYELRVRSVDQNGYAQPQPRPNPRSGRNRIQCKEIVVT